MSDINLLDYIRPYDPVKDKDLPEYSHSRIECYLNCPYQFKLKYVDEKSVADTTLALACGSICHKVLELKGINLKLNPNEPIRYDILLNILEEGCDDDEHYLIGRQEIKKKYWEEYNTKDSENRTYNDKFETFIRILKTEMEDSDWQPFAFEKEFHFVYKNRIHIKGFIDRIDRRGNELRVVDYKTSKKVYDEAKNKTSQQFALYNMALLIMYGQLAADNLYRFIFLDAEQHALSKGWEERIIRKLDKTLDQIDENQVSGIYPPKATPLCYYCSFCRNNPQATIYKNECDYYSLWTPTNRTFEKNKEFNPELIQKKARVFDW